MKQFYNFYNMKVGIVDLTRLSSEVLPLDDRVVAEKIGGAAVNEDLFRQYGDDAPLVIGVGPLTGSFAPASCLAVATFLSPRFGNLCHVPLMLRTGPEMKFSGIDFMVIKGTASSPRILHVDMGSVRILSAEHLIGVDIPEGLQTLKKEIPHSRSTILTGPAADHRVSGASVSTGTNGSLDKAGLALVMASKNLKGIIFNGVDGLPFAEGNLNHSESIQKNLFTENVLKNKGFFSMLSRIGVVGNLKKITKRTKWHDRACYHCPFPCMSAIEFRWHDPRKRSADKDTIFLSDHLGFLALARKRGDDVFPLTERCLRFGLDPVSVAERLPESGSLLESLNAIEEMAVTPEGREIESEPRQIGEVPGAIHTRFGGGLPPILPGELWKKRVWLSMILGVCPIFSLLFTQISEDDLLEFLTSDETDLISLRKEIQSISQG